MLKLFSEKMIKDQSRFGDIAKPSDYNKAHNMAK